MMPKCPNCGIENRDNVAACVNCRTPLAPAGYGGGLSGGASPGGRSAVVWAFVGASVLIVVAVFAWFFSESLFATRVERNEAAAIESLRALTRAAYDYAERYRRAPATLAALGPPAAGEEAGEDAAGLIDAEFSEGARYGYRFRYEPVDADGDGTPDGFRFYADPVTPGESGTRWFFTDATGTIRESRDGPATAASPPIPREP
jgi:hypothetical protein